MGGLLQLEDQCESSQQVPGYVLLVPAFQGNGFNLHKEMEIVYFGAEGCPQCRVLKPQVEAWCKRKNVKLTFVDMDDEENEEMAEGLKVRSLPTVLVVEDGDVKRRIVGISGWKEYEG